MANRRVEQANRMTSQLGRWGVLNSCKAAYSELGRSAWVGFGSVAFGISLIAARGIALSRIRARTTKEAIRLWLTADGAGVRGV